MDMHESSRLRLMLDPLQTAAPASAALHLQSIPLSAATITPSGYTQSPASAIQPYNPQEWGAPAVRAAERLPSGLGHARSPDGTAPPPPPYSPSYVSQPRPISMSFEPSTANTSATRVPLSRLGSTDGPQSFPPPPAAESRRSSRERRFGLSSFTRRRDTEQAQGRIQITPGGSMENAANVRGLSVYVPSNESFGLLPSPGPPSSRRAASASAIETPGWTDRASGLPQEGQWRVDIPIPPPPPGPPPSQARSQSAQSYGRDRPIMSPPTRRPPPSGVSALGPVPPTPANWTDETPVSSSSPPPPVPRQITQTQDTESLSSCSQSQTNSSSTITNSEQVEESQAYNISQSQSAQGDKTIAQRRSESRVRSNQSSLEYNGQPAEITIPSTTTLSRSGATRITPRSGKFNETPTSRTGEFPESSKSLRVNTSTPHSGASKNQTDSLVAQTPPSRSRASSAIRNAGSSGEASQSALLAAKQKAITQTADQFSHDTIERYKAFATREAAVASDAERVRLFADFIVAESRIRRERYSNAISIMGSEIFDLTRDLFRPMASRRSSSVSQSDWTPQSSVSLLPSATTANTNFGDGADLSSSAPNSASMTSSLPPSPGPMGNNLQWSAHGFMPSLSPILSLSIADDCDSRGRPVSRWWEAGSEGRVEGGLLRSKRESKYMGVPKEAREALQWEDEPQSSDWHQPSSSETHDVQLPGKKDDNLTPHSNRFSIGSQPTSSQPNTPNAALVDVSRLVTMPPPYPRHHPAVNNNHPDLTDIRNEVRVLSNMAEISSIKEEFEKKNTKLKATLVQEQVTARRKLVQNLQAMVDSGELSYMDASTIEKDNQEQQKRAKIKELDEKSFEGFQREVVLPLNEMLTARITKATELLNSLAIGLFNHSDNAADLPQEEGDDQPELLEKLSLLKWIFETRESLYKAIFDLLSARNDRYLAVALIPHQLSGNEDKIRHTKAYFGDDATKRKSVFAVEIRNRTLEFQNVVEQTVMRGCQVQLNAFWDIAPPLSGVLDKVPSSLEGFRIQIPGAEYDENPAYYDHPLQYLFSLLLHAEKSTYQFIESQTNMLCLLHEIKEASAHAQAKVIETEIPDGGGKPSADERARRAQELLKRETNALSMDLKEKVRTVQDQWKSGFGEVVEGVKERVGEYLLRTGGWDEQLEEGGLAVGVL
ncbi:uncharacterized protein BROUX77_006409 [Berkeleyomyces rouxiae]|uniref:uncharacterized protein n=1 Tax=Berkeleyomyces rouxiae TaxID=2035830 RepID=UPI003B80950C